jgi:hypothetical protein
VKTDDLQTVLTAVELALRILGEYIQPGSRDATITVKRLLDTLDDRDVEKALDHLRRRQIIRLVD